MTEPVQLIRNALAAFESADSYREDKEAVCNFHDALTRPIVIALLARLDASELDAAKLRAFAQEILKDWPDCTVDGFDIQELADKNGLLVGTMKTESCGESCNCEEYGDFPMLCYTKTELLKGKL